MNSTLNDLGLHYGTDKSTLRHNYLSLYEQYLEPRRNQPLTLLELGVLDGASLRMWRDYLPNASIVGLDHKPAISIPGCITVQGSQDDPAAIARVAQHGPFDVIIDDASHISSKTIASFELFYPHLAPGGLYVIEDLHASYWPAIYGDQDADYNPDTNKRTIMAYLKRFADNVNFDPTQHPKPDDIRQALYPRQYWRGYHLQSITINYGIAFITKHPNA